MSIIESVTPAEIIALVDDEIDEFSGEPVGFKSADVASGVCREPHTICDESGSWEVWPARAEPMSIADARQYLEELEAVIEAAETLDHRAIGAAAAAHPAWGNLSSKILEAHGVSQFQLDATPFVSETDGFIYLALAFRSRAEFEHLTVDAVYAISDELKSLALRLAEESGRVAS